MPSFIETQFPVSKLSKESYKERKAGSGQTLTGLGKWWGRKPLVLVRATLLGLLLPATDDPKTDQNIFLALLTMDDEGFKARQNKNIPYKKLQTVLSPSELDTYFTANGRWKKGTSKTTKTDLQQRALLRLSYDERLTYCARPEQIDGPSPESWATINAHCNTNAKSLSDWVQQMGERQFGHTPRVGDAFCGGGSVPFEAARLGCEAYGSDLNPVAALLTWAALNIIGGGEKVQQQVKAAQQAAFEAADQQITDWGIEHNEKGWRADAYLYCVETRCPSSGYLVPLAPSWVISEKYKVCAVLQPDHANQGYDIAIVTEADDAIFQAARQGTVSNSRLICPQTGDEHAIASLRGDNTINGETVYGLRLWENDDLVPRPDDVFQERLYCIRYIETYYRKPIYQEDTLIGYEELDKATAEALPNFDELLEKGDLKAQTRRHYCAPDAHDLAREEKVLQLLQERFHDWQNKGFIPSTAIPSGIKTEEPKRTRGWTYWHHLFTPRQLLVLGLLNKKSSQYIGTKAIGTLLLGIGASADWCSRLTRWTGSLKKSGGIGAVVAQTMYNQALNTLFNYGTKSYLNLYFHYTFQFSDPTNNFVKKNFVLTNDAVNIQKVNDFWITDPPYADAINYHELADFFLAWYEKQLPQLFPDWHTSSKAALAVKGKGQAFNKSMVEVYSNLARCMPDDGAQVVMFTHQDAKVWADLALILWASGLRVTAAWTIQTETDAGGIKKGSYVQGTVLMVLRKQTSGETGFLFDIQDDVEHGVKEQIQFMQSLDEGDDPNFSDTDYQLAAYAAALRELTRYQQIGEIDVEYELTKTRKAGEENEIEKIIATALGVAMNSLVPKDMDEQFWRELSPEERFYLKGLEIEQGGEYRSGVYTEMARGYGLHEYNHLLHTSKANETRLRTATEFKNKELKTKEGFGNTLTRQVLYALYETAKHEEPEKGRNWLYTELKDYWGSRKLILAVLQFLQLKTKHIPHWQQDNEAITLLLGYLLNDTTSMETVN